MHSKRGQITFFVVLGMIILVVIGTTIYIFQASISSSKETPFETVPYDVLNVEKHVTSCLNDALEGAVGYCSGNFPEEFGGGPKCDPYEESLEERIIENFCSCIPGCRDFSMFKNLEVEVKGDPNPEAILTGDKKKIMLTMEYPITVKKDNKEHRFGTAGSPFFAEYSLEQSGCVPISVNNHEECKATEDKTVELLGLILEYHEGDKVAIGGECIAC